MTFITNEMKFVMKCLKWLLALKRSFKILDNERPNCMQNKTHLQLEFQIPAILHAIIYINFCKDCIAMQTNFNKIALIGDSRTLAILHCKALFAIDCNFIGGKIHSVHIQYI